MSSDLYGAAAIASVFMDVGCVKQYRAIRDAYPRRGLIRLMILSFVVCVNSSVTLLGRKPAGMHYGSAAIFFLIFLHAFVDHRIQKRARRVE